MALKLKEVIDLIEKEGWYFARYGKGSHMIYKHPTNPMPIILPNHGMNKELKPGMENDILKTAGLK